MSSRNANSAGVPPCCGGWRWLWACVGALIWAWGPVGGGMLAAADHGGKLDVHAQYRRLLQQAEQAFKDGHYRQAWSSAASLSRVQGGGYDDVHHAARALIDKLEARAESIFEAGEKHWWYREYQEAEPQYKLLFEEFPHSKYFVRARGRLIALRFMPAVASKKLLTAARAKEDEQQYAEATKRYLQLIAQYPDTPAAIHAQQALNALANDPTKRRAGGEEAVALLARELDGKWRLAENYLKTPPQDAGDWLLYDRGVAYLHEIIALAPDSPQADKARARIRVEQERIAAEEAAREAARAQAQRENAAAAEKVRQSQR